jgi:hypothetical protein
VLNLIPGISSFTLAAKVLVYSRYLRSHTLYREGPCPKLRDSIRLSNQLGHILTSIKAELFSLLDGVFHRNQLCIGVLFLEFAQEQVVDCIGANNIPADFPDSSDDINERLTSLDQFH